MLAVEGALVSGVGLAVGLALGAVISLVLIHVVNRQSFHWSMDLSVPWGALAAFVTAVLALSVATAVLAAGGARPAATRCARCGRTGDGATIANPEPGVKRRAFLALPALLVAPAARTTAPLCAAVAGHGAALPARPRQPSRISHRVVVPHRLAAATRRARARLPGHVLPQPAARGRRRLQPRSRRGSSCSRTPRWPMRRPAGCCTTSAPRARCSASPRRDTGTTRVWIRDWRLARAGDGTMRRHRRDGVPAGARPARRRSRCCCRATAAFRARGREPAQASYYYSRAAARGERVGSASAATSRRRERGAPGSITSGRARSWRQMPSAGTGSGSTSTTAAR